MATTYVLKPSDRLWGTIRIWAWIFMAGAVLIMAAQVWRLSLMMTLPSDTPMTDGALLSDYIGGADLDLMLLGLGVLLYLVAYVVCIILVLMWYLRSVRNAHVLFRGIETSPAWAIWWFIIPVASLWKPYGMTSELWRSSQDPEKWRGKSDPAFLRVWWGSVLASGFAGIISNAAAKAAQTVGQLMFADIFSLTGLGLTVLAGVLFLRIGGAVSKAQTRLIAEGHRPEPAKGPSWSA